jgi:hypothetical protein
MNCPWKRKKVPDPALKMILETVMGEVKEDLKERMEKKDVTLQHQEKFRHIPDLKPGEPLRLIFGGTYKFPEKGKIVHVFRALPGIESRNEGQRMEEDFSVLIGNNEECNEVTYDSRYFERVPV